MHHLQTFWQLLRWIGLATLLSTYSHALLASEACNNNECTYPFTLNDIGFYAVIADLPEDSSEGRFGFSLDTNATFDGFFGGTILAENGQVPAYASFTLQNTTPLNINAIDYNGQLNAVNIQVKRSGEETPIFGPVEQAIATELTTDALDAGSYTVEITSLAGAPRSYLGMEVAAEGVTGTISTGGWLDANTGENYFAFFAGETPLSGTLKTQFGNSFTGGATGMNLAGYIYNPVSDTFDFLFSDTTSSGEPTTPELPTSLRLSLIHINDHHSHLVEENFDLDFNGVETRVKLGGFPRVAAKIKELRETSENPLVLHIGDAISGTLYYTLFKGEADVTLMNSVGFDAFVLGNHEFDDGNANLANFLAQAEFPTITANIDFSASEDLRDAGIEPFIIREINGQQVALVGIDTLKTLTSSSPGPELIFKDEVESAREQVAILEAQGINKIILMTHYGYQQDQDLAAQVGGVDVILGGDSHTLLGDFTEFGLTSEGPYPTLVTSPRGEPVCIAQAWQYAYIVGSLSVGFDENGLLTECEGDPIMLIGDTFQQEDAEGERQDVSPEVRAEIESIIAANGNIAIVAPDPQIESELAVYSAQVEEQSRQVIGQAATDLLHIRIPGTHPSGVELPNGSLIAPLVADAFFFEMQQKNLTPDLVIQNAGGVRIDVPQGEITIETAYTLLPFSNTIYLIEMTGAEVKQVLEDALVNHFDNGGSTGSFPYASQIRYTIEVDCPANQRISSLEIRDADGNYAPIDPARLYRVGTNSFIASGRDGYTTFATVQETRPGLDTFIDYAMSFVNYTQAQGTLQAPESTGVTYITGQCSNPVSETTPQAILRGRAVLPAATFADGPTSGNALGVEPVNQQPVPFVNQQPVQGFSAVLDNGDGSFLVMSDNGFGGMENSADYHLRVYTIRPDFETAEGGSGNIAVEGFFELKDPNNLIPFAITQQFSEERILTGADFDLESFQRAPDGTFWFGEEFGPFLLHTDANGVLLEAPIPLPDFANAGQELRAPQNPFQEDMSAVRLMNAVHHHAMMNGNTRRPVFSPYHVMLKYDGSDVNAHYARGDNPHDGVADAASDVFEIQSLQRAGYDVVTWTVNDKPRMLELMAAGVNGIISDRVDLLWEAVNEFDGNEDGQPDYLTPEGLIDGTQFDAQGHRGARNLRPENTLPSMEVALDFLMTTLETDTGVTSDGVPILKHDPYIENVKCRRADGQPYPDDEQALIKDLTVVEIQSTFICDLNPGRGDTQLNDPELSPVSVAFAAQAGLSDIYVMPTVQQLFDFVNFYVDYYQSGAGQSAPEAEQRWRNAAQVRFNLETKINPRSDREAGMLQNIYRERTVDCNTMADTLANTIVSNNLADRADIQSFDFCTLLRVQAESPTIRTVYLFGDFPIYNNEFSDDGTNLQDENGANSPWLAGLYWPYRVTRLTNPFSVPGSGGFEGMAITPDGSKLVTLLEKPLTNGTAGELLMHEFDIASKAYTGVQYRYPLNERASAIGDFILFTDTSGLVIERDGSQGDMEGFKRIYRVNLPAGGGLAEKVLAVDLLRIQDPDLISLPANEGDVGLGETFGFPFVTIEDVVILGERQIGVLNDNNYPFSIGRQVGAGLPDDNEFIVLELEAGLLQ